MLVSRETMDRLDDYASLIRKWNPRINLIAPATLSDLHQRHIQDCLQLVDLASASHGRWVDLGSGGGLPGLVVAISRPDLSVTLMEVDQRKAAFIKTVIRELGLVNSKVIVNRIESADPLNAENVSARALAPLPLLMSYVNRHISALGTAWLMKGKSWQAEVEEARKTWQFDLIAHQSITNSDAAILEISGIRHD